MKHSGLEEPSLNTRLEPAALSSSDDDLRFLFETVCLTLTACVWHEVFNNSLMWFAMSSTITGTNGGFAS
jgi:hypothetical protein